ncbi:hypothetical protein CHCC14820_1553 [Bacillus paralicheniformis]|uniref:Uncharacterized protein n=1 Tax=Bacillus paralicheniformis TaxID=1648923 RepID=A0A6I7TJP6_9BACI|nr:hypothetical protein SC10_B2orf01592 [Bacillus paralicheniformis]OLF89301.1 hypothetical protein B4121_3694 [Bacillus paralicheniformis]OLG06378.1 hypothetical protein B4125_0559 [Bacillus paralicheniformis]TWJ41293.1 hypothetical protein CHCC5027_1271 [Bacillus paralicheniformis]TWJ61815.1 hypothetical protein CHCC5022_2287 [Bacillus paralicheniformis]
MHSQKETSLHKRFSQKKPDAGFPGVRLFLNIKRLLTFGQQSCMKISGSQLTLLLR